MFVVVDVGGDMDTFHTFGEFEKWLVELRSKFVRQMTTAGFGDAGTLLSPEVSGTCRNAHLPLIIFALVIRQTVRRIILYFAIRRTTLAYNVHAPAQYLLEFKAQTIRTGPYGLNARLFIRVQ